MRRVYLDHAATTALDPRVFEAMLPYLKEHYGNASSVHQLGRRARFVVEESREKIAALLGAEPGEIIFTSGGTEADNTALRGALYSRNGGLLTSAAEHEAVLRPAEALAREGVPVKVIMPHAHGGVDLELIQFEITANTALVSFMHANNEVGTMNPVSEIASWCHERSVLVHCDAVQSAGLQRLSVDELGVDYLSISAHKFYGPKGVGVLYVRGGVPLEPLIHGGAQERRRRGGTENVPAIVGMAKALELASEASHDHRPRIEALRDRLAAGIRENLDGLVLFNTPFVPGVEIAPHIVNISFPPVAGEPVDGEMLLLNLDMEGVLVSSGSACTSGAVEPSHVLRAMSVDPRTAGATVRFSIGKDNTEADIDYAVEKLVGVVERMTTSAAQ